MNIRRCAQAANLALVVVTVIALSACGGTTAAGGATALPPPKFGQSVDVGLISGIVIVTPAAGKSFRLGAQDRNIPVGSQIDTSRGQVDLRSAVAPGRASATPGATAVQDAQFLGALFKILQRTSQAGLTELDLITRRKRLRSCAAGTATATPGPVHLSSRILQTLRSRDSGGRFQTRGRFSAATVRGTVWDTIDRCDGTLTVVHRGSVYVYEYATGTTVTLYAGHSYLAKAPTG